MDGMRKYYPVLLLALLLAVLSGCPQPEPGDLPFDAPDYVKMAVWPNGSPYPLRVACYVDVEKYNPLNALDYTLDNGEGTPYFDYVILGPARIKKGQSGKGASLFCSPALKTVLDQRRSFIVPFQKRGIRVLLGITGGVDDISFGSIEDLYFQQLANYDIHFYQQRLADEISWFLNYYGLDGVEFYDTGAAKSADPVTYPYPDGSYEGVTVNKYSDEGERQDAWINGGIQYNYFMWMLRMLIQNYENKPIILREKNYGCYLNEEIIGAAYQARNDQLNFFVNPNFASFGGILLDDMGNVIEEGKSVNNGVDNWMYGPLSVDLENIVPPVYDTTGNDLDITGFSDQLANASEWYGLIFYNNLKPRSQENDALLDTRPGADPGSRLSQADYFSITSEKVFGSKVVCSGGDYQKTW
jgi:hypothetical protein